MKLDRTTRSLVKVGTVLNDGEFSAIVTNMAYGATGGISVTLMLQTGRLAGHVLYGEPLSTYYGCEMENTAEHDRLINLAARLDSIARDAEQYDCEDYEGSTEEALENLKNDPIGVIEYLVGMIEDLA